MMVVPHVYSAPQNEGIDLPTPSHLITLALPLAIEPFLKLDGVGKCSSSKLTCQIIKLVRRLDYVLRL